MRLCRNMSDVCVCGAVMKIGPADVLRLIDSCCFVCLHPQPRMQCVLMN